MAELSKPKGKAAWIIGGLVVLLVLWFLAKRGSQAQVIPSSSGNASDAQLQAAGQGFGALASFAAAQEAAQAQLASIQAEAAAYLQGQQLQAGATDAAAARYANAQKNAYVWGTIRDIGVTVAQGLLSRGRGGSGAAVPGYGGGSAGPAGFGGGVAI